MKPTLLFVLLSFSTFLRAQNFNWNCYSGFLSQTSIASAGGYRWISTGGGLIRYDPVSNSYSTLTTCNSFIPTNIIGMIKADHAQNLWLVSGYYSSNGITKFDGVDATNYNLSQLFDLPYISITDLAFTSDDQVWISSYEGIFHFNGQSWELFNASNSDFDNDYFPSITVDDQDHVWAATSYCDYIAVEYENSTWNHISTAGDLGINYGNAIKLAFGGGKLWAFGNGINQLFSYKNGVWKQHRQPENFGYILDVAFDADNKLWCTNGSGQVYKWVYDSLQLQLNPFEQYCLRICADENYDLWSIGGSNTIVKISNNSWSEYDLTDLPDKDFFYLQNGDNYNVWLLENTSAVKIVNDQWTTYNVKGIIAADPSSGDLYSATADSVWHLQNGSWTKYASPLQGVYDFKNVSSLKVDNNHHLLASFSYGYIFQSGKGESYAATYRLNGSAWENLNCSKYVSAISVDHLNRYWIYSHNENGGSDSLMKYENGTWSGVPAPTTGFNAIACDLYNNIYIAQGETIYVYDGSQWSQPVLYGLPENSMVHTIYFDPSNDIYLGMETGLYFSKPNGAATFMNRDNNNLPADNITSLVVDANNNLWIESGSVVAECEDCAAFLTAVPSISPDQPEVTVFPNPAHDDVSFSITTPRSMTIRITLSNVLGQTLFNEKENLPAGDVQVPIQLNSFEAGVYLYKISNDDQLISSGKIILE